MGLETITKTENELYFQDGVKTGLELKNEQEKFLREHTLGQMRYKKNKEEYQRLFKVGRY